ncbi:helix-turn-helix domain-containing protein [Alteromonas sp.]|jgi:DNA-binding HxlR family transcriptional regulator|uniref:winged helix-turn-helix transcriptional regulator n=1 Tax=Alteromonas sp. TaxID=232 RepID=UPI000B708E9B|nr:helix-turn-helix domain-containing protein [Alteromonas sp.]MAI37187.1 transcriptional regulator [Alteromonas sp.]OUX89430.1 MAG: transcriptional regulator [Alteromonas sp. TMED35]|tara:strand:+ start:17786 stop:18196 length:411 start_codon:yes stop_codon:yes gene_type:complete
MAQVLKTDSARLSEHNSELEIEKESERESNQETPQYICGVAVSLEIIGGKWKGVILWHLCHKTLRFSQLRRRLQGVTQKMLTQQLRELERDKLVNRKVYAEVPPRVEYSLTELGRTLEPTLRQLCEWGKDYNDNHR